MTKFDDINIARRDMIKTIPFIASYLFGLESKIDNSENNPTACTDGKSIMYNESFIANLTFKQLKTLVAHEVCHVAFAHHFRMRGKDGQLWNVACDYAINLLLVAMGFVPLPNWLLDYKYKGMSAEDIYRDLSNQSQEDQDQQKQKSEQSGGSFEEPKDQDGNDLSDTDLEEAKQDAKEKLQQTKGNMKKAKEAIENSNLPDNEKRELIDQIGQGFADVMADIDFESSARADWQDILRRFLFSMAENDFAIHVPDERFISESEFLMPSYESNEIGNLFVAMDVSGSCAEEAKQIATEAREILDEMEGASNSVMKACYCSNYIHRIHEIRSVDDIQLIYGGGTDFLPAINAFAEDYESQACVYITDGWCDSFGDDPIKPVLWVLTRRNDRFNPPFGEVVLMN